MTLCRYNAFITFKNIAGAYLNQLLKQCQLLYSESQKVQFSWLQYFSESLSGPLKHRGHNLQMSDYWPVANQIYMVCLFF